MSESTREQMIEVRDLQAQNSKKQYQVKVSEEIPQGSIFFEVKTREEAENIILSANINGIGLNNIQIIATPSSLIFHLGSNDQKKFIRVISLPSVANVDRAYSTLKDDQLVIVLPKATGSKEIEIPLP